LGVSRLLGIELLKNFNFPYFSRDIAEFWRRWHISLSTWFRDYVYVPLGGSRVGKWTKIRNTFIIFLISGFWHGANWTFIFWGFLNACYIIPSVFLNRNRINLHTVASGKILPTLKEFFQIGLTFFLVLLAWVFFRSASIQDAFMYLKQMFRADLFKIPYFPNIRNSIPVFIYLLFFIIIEWIGRENHYAIQKFGMRVSGFYRWTFFYVITFSIFYFFAKGKVTEFIYFQF
jgi:D-alanyl-lipoteichoic acid acyltransferase DltB (MBOAT superfamily)